MNDDKKNKNQDQSYNKGSNVDEKFTDQQLKGFISNPPDGIRNNDGAFDRNTKIGKALYEGKMIDDKGYPTNDSNRDFDKNRDSNVRDGNR